MNLENQNLKNRIQSLKDALEKIVDPISAMRKELKEGEVLNGAYAAQISNDANYLKSIAKEALSTDENINDVDSDSSVKAIEQKTDFTLELLSDFSDHLKEDYGVEVPEKAFVTFLEV